MILQIAVYLMEMVLALIPAFLYWCGTESTVMAVAVYVIALYLMIRFTMWFVNRPEKPQEQYDTIIVNKGLLHKVIKSDGTITIYAHPRWDGGLQDVDDFLSEDLNSRSYVMGHSRTLKSTFKGMNVVFSNVRQ